MVSHNTYHLISIFLTLDKVYLLMATPLDLEYGVAPLGPPAPAQLPSPTYNFKTIERILGNHRLLSHLDS